MRIHSLLRKQSAESRVKESEVEISVRSANLLSIKAYGDNT